MTSIKKLIKSFTPYQIIYLSAVVLLTVAFLIFFPEYMFEEGSAGFFLVFITVVDTLANPLCELLIAKQSKWNFVVDFFFIEIPEVLLCLHFGWYAIAASVVLFWMPVDVVSFIRWSKHPDREDDTLTRVKQLKPWQSLLVVVGIFAFGFIAGDLLQHIPGASDTYLDAFATAVGMTNGILLLLRYSEQWIAWLITTVLYIFMDISQEAYILLVSEFAMLVNTIYGIVKWRIYVRTHQNEKE
jgi:nicotinamide mononucleotide transporter